MPPSNPSFNGMAFGLPLTQTLGVMIIPLLAVFSFVCIAAALQGVMTTRYVRDNYPSIWARFKFSGNGWWVEAKDEAPELEARKQYKSFLKSKERVRLQDIRLNKMIAVHRVLNYLGAVLFIATVASWLSTAHFN
ncbi:MAG: hypothetical protein JWL63_2364 [Rhodocyclales bacterium]|nr:hypothetical protein [Rhodocyclales bacterium]